MFQKNHIVTVTRTNGHWHCSCSLAQHILLDPHCDKECFHVQLFREIVDNEFRYGKTEFGKMVQNAFANHQEPVVEVHPQVILYS